MNPSSQVHTYRDQWTALRALAAPVLEQIAASIQKDTGSAAHVDWDETGDSFAITLEVARPGDDNPSAVLEVTLVDGELCDDHRGANLRVVCHRRTDSAWQERRVYVPFNVTPGCWTESVSEIERRFRGIDFAPFVFGLEEAGNCLERNIEVCRMLKEKS